MNVIEDVLYIHSVCSLVTRPSPLIRGRILTMWTVMSVDPAAYNERLAGRPGNEAIVYECDRVIV